MNARHYEKDDFPKRCDHCPAPLLAGTRYRKVLAVLDAEDSFAGGEMAFVEHSFELTLCVRCFTRLSNWIHHPLSELPAEGEEPVELDDAELESQLEKELFILGDGEEKSLADSTAAGCRLRDPEGNSVSVAPSCPLHPKGDDLACYSCHRVRVSPKPSPCLDPDKMLGAGDQFPGSDFDEEKLS